MTDETHDIQALVKRRIEELGLNMSQVSLRLGRNRAYIHQFVERGIPKRLPGTARSQLAEILQIDEGQLVPPGVRWAAPVRQVPSRSEAVSLRPDAGYNDIPVLGTALSSDAASDFVFSGEIIDYIRCPPALAKAKGCFALRVVGDVMAPRFEPGNIVIVQSGRVPSANDYVVIELHAKEDALPAGFLRRLTAYAPDHIVCEQFNPQKKSEFRIEDIKTLYRVISTDELFGVPAV
jgi:phage repressor protein C with HTH and peptisase S24 domain